MGRVSNFAYSTRDRRLPSHFARMPTCSLPQDKPELVFMAAMMAIQNYGFYQMYYQIYGGIPVLDTCDDLRFWIGFFALDCFVESFVCVWMAMAGYTDDQNFPFYWVLHLLVALPYVVCTITIPLAMYDDKGKACRIAGGVAMKPLVSVYWLHCGLFMVYVWMMLNVTYYSWARATLFSGGEDSGSVVVVKPSSSPVEQMTEVEGA